MAKYASDTNVSADRTKAEIERTLVRYGADQFAYGWTTTGAVIGFRLHDRQYRFVLPLPDRNSQQFRFTPQRRYERSEEEVQRAYDQAVRQRWRALLLIIKAKLEAVEAGITTAEDEFLASTIMADGSTLGEWAAPQIGEMYRSGRMPELIAGLPGGSRPALTAGGSKST